MPRGNSKNTQDGGGGTLAHTKWDKKGWDALEAELRKRPELHRPGLKKHEIARLLADDDKAKKDAARKRMKDKKNQITAQSKQFEEQQQKLVREREEPVKNIEQPVKKKQTEKKTQQPDKTTREPLKATVHPQKALTQAEKPTKQPEMPTSLPAKMASMPEEIAKRLDKTTREVEKTREPQKRMMGLENTTKEPENTASEPEKMAQEPETQQQAGEEVTDTVGVEGNIVGPEKIGHLLEGDETTEPTESETTTTISASSPMFSNSKLRLFEWPDLELPPLYPPQSLDGLQVEREIEPYSIPYAVMNLVTTITLPGRTYPDPVEAGFTPKLTPDVMKAARNGVLVGTLRKAVIESGKSWAERTQVQWWTGRMYFRLPAPSSTAPLAVTAGKISQSKNGKAKRPRQTPRDKQLEMLRNYASCEYRPPIGFAPVFLDYPSSHDVEAHGPISLENLFYIRFPGMDLPHYYFWTRPHEWQDPMTPNPEWLPAKTREEAMQQNEPHELDRVLREKDRQLYVRRTSQADRGRPYSLDLSKMRVRKAGVRQKFWTSSKRLSPRPSKFDTSLREIERQLYGDGLATVLQRCRQQWIRDGKKQHLHVLIDNMARLYPSGKLPQDPPVHVDQVPRSMAEKIASIHVLGPSRPVSPIQGDEPWTRDDDEYWDVVDAPARSRSRSDVSEADIQHELLRTIESDPGHLGTPTRGAASIPGANRYNELDMWLESLQFVSDKPVLETLAMPSSPLDQAVRAAEREWWEGVFEQAQADAAEASRSHRRLRSSSIVTNDYSFTGYAIPGQGPQAQSLSVAELKWQLHTLMNKHLKHETHCRVCFEPFEQGDVKAMKRHYQRHHDEADAKCPFCGMAWGMLDSQWKASHIFTHDFDDSIQQRRRSSVPVALYSIPRRRSLNDKEQNFRPSSLSSPAQSRSVRSAPERRRSKVHFSPKVVEKRVPYNNKKQKRVEDAAVGEMDSSSPRKSSLKKTTIESPELKGGREGERLTNKRRNSVDLDPTGIPPTPSSDYIFSPELHRVRPRRNGHSEAAWDPRRHPDSDSSHAPSPYLPPSGKRHDKVHPDAAFDPRRWSTSSEQDLDSVVWKKRKTRSGSDISKTRGNRVTKAKARSRTTQTTVSMKTLKGRGGTWTNAILEEESPPPGLESHLYRKVSISEQPYLLSPSASSSTSTYSSVPSVASSIERQGKRKAKSKSRVIDRTYRDVPPPAISSEISPILRFRRRASDPAWKYESASETPSPVVSKKRKRKQSSGRTSKRRATAPAMASTIDEDPVPVHAKEDTQVEPQRTLLPLKIPFLSTLSRMFGVTGEVHASSTVSNASSNSIDRIEEALQNPDLDVIAPDTDPAKPVPRSSTTSKGRGASATDSPLSSKKRKTAAAQIDDVATTTPSPSTKKRTMSVAEGALHRRFSLLPMAASDAGGDEREVNKVPSVGDNYMAFSNDYLAHDSDDPLMGNPFAAPPKRGPTAKRKQITAKAKKERQGKGKGKPNNDVAAVQSKGPKIKTTLLGRPFVGPLLIAPAQRLGRGIRKSSRGVRHPGAEIQTPTPIATSPSATSHVPITPAETEASSRSQPSPSLPHTGVRTTRSTRSARAVANSPLNQQQQQQEHTSPRGRRSTAPTLSPSISLESKKSRDGQGKERVQTQKHPDLPAIPVKRHSYDVPYSDVRPLAPPPNTPALGLNGLARFSSGRNTNAGVTKATVRRSSTSVKLSGPKAPEILEFTPSMEERLHNGVDDGSTTLPEQAPIGLGITLCPSPLDAGVLAHKIEQAKISKRRAVTSNAPAVVGISALASSAVKGHRKANGKGNGDVKGDKIDKVITGRVGKKPRTLAKSKARAKPGSEAEAGLPEHAKATSTTKTAKSDGNSRKNASSQAGIQPEGRTGVVTRSMAKRK